MSENANSVEFQDALAGSREALPNVLKSYRPADIVNWLDGSAPEQKIRVFEALDIRAAGILLDQLDSESQLQILKEASSEHLGHVILNLPPDEVADLLLKTHAEHREALLRNLPAQKAAVIRDLLTYPSDTAGGLMTTDVACLSSGMKVGEALSRLHAGEETETIYQPCVVDADGVLLGVVPLPRLVFAAQDISVSEIMISKPVTARLSDDQEVIGRLFTEHDLISLPVVDGNGHLAGVITVDDVMEAIEEEFSEDMYRIAGTSERDPLHGPLTTKVWLRLPWLFLTLAGGLLVCRIVKQFEGSIQQLVALASFLPLIPLIGGNVAVQASTIVVRGIAIGTVQRRSAFHLIIREVGVAAIMGFACACLIGIVAFFLYEQQNLSYVIAISVFSAVNVAVLLGTTIPLMFSTFGIDPALAAGPVVTILNDIASVSIYLGLATLLLCG